MVVELHVDVAETLHPWPLLTSHFAPYFFCLSYLAPYFQVTLICNISCFLSDVKGYLARGLSYQDEMTWG